ncbi:hypothetical protein O181_002977 [Austropuccinia psidii MF-1]|uniref:Uncharacterized protein n=1 Tax=Austropuccinia psidii MF-1 TaxID=1389203 RepID=A0A9Q3BDU2_9BASI|nr:hypothetical protein [Austropuccinia psidii MF-1]
MSIALDFIMHNLGLARISCRALGSGALSCSARSNYNERIPSLILCLCFVLLLESSWLKHWPQRTALLHNHSANTHHPSSTNSPISITSYIPISYKPQILWCESLQTSCSIVSFFQPIVAMFLQCLPCFSGQSSVVEDINFEKSMKQDRALTAFEATEKLSRMEMKNNFKDPPLLPQPLVAPPFKLEALFSSLFGIKASIPEEDSDSINNTSSHSSLSSFSVPTITISEA